MMIDSLGDRMKNAYEDRYRFKLPRRTNTLVRLDGKSFHNYTSGCDRPYDTLLMDAMDSTGAYLAQELQGAQAAYVQSDEISLLLTDYSTIYTEAAFDGNLQKIVSIAASIATARFNWARGVQRDVFPEQGHKISNALALFDARAFIVPDPVEVHNYFVWRQKDAIRNSISMTAQTYFSPKELYRKSQADMLEMMTQHGVDWFSNPGGFRYGRLALYDTGKGWQIREAEDFTLNTPILKIVESVRQD